VEANIAEVRDLLYLAQVFTVALPHAEHRPAEPNICSQKWGKGLAGVRASTVIVSWVA
jgi:hypothetical protein